MYEFLISVASTVAGALLLMAAREIRRASRTVGESAAAVASLTTQVSALDQHDAQNRERIAALWARVFPDNWTGPNGN